ncbi:MAG: hypothetical protein IPK82_39835 [Polyangiaceae bacterium]|nr:hypothetical protein [Polyangiaceae bacterium]
MWGVAIPVDPGTTTLTVSAPGKKNWTTALDIPATPGARTVEIPALEDLPAEPPPTATASSTAAGPTATAVSSAAPTSTAPSAGWSTGRTVGLTLGIAGAVGVGIGAAFGGIAASQFSSAKTTCPAVACNDAAAVDLSKQAGTSADISTVLFAAGGAVLATGIVVFLISPSHAAAPTPAAWVTPMVGKGSASLGVGGRF